MIAGIHRQSVGDEEQVEFPTLGGACDGLHHRKAATAHGGAFGAPSGRMIAGAEHEDAEMHLTLAIGHDRCSPPTSRCGYSSRARLSSTSAAPTAPSRRERPVRRRQV